MKVSTEAISSVLYIYHIALHDFEGPHEVSGIVEPLESVVLIPCDLPYNARCLRK